MASQAAIVDASNALARGKAVVFPTDTVYGIGVSVGHAAGPDAVFEAKGRDRSKPVAWLVGGLADLDTYGDGIPAYARQLAEAFWPGQLTLIVRASDAVPPSFASSERTIGVRMPASETSLELIRKAGCPIATSSANRAGEPPATTFEELDPAILERVAVAVRDDGARSGLASTVVDCTGEVPVVLREGAITEAVVRDFS